MFVLRLRAVWFLLFDLLLNQRCVFSQTPDFLKKNSCRCLNQTRNKDVRQRSQPEHVR